MKPTLYDTFSLSKLDLDVSGREGIAFCNFFAVTDLLVRTTVAQHIILLFMDRKKGTTDCTRQERV